MPDATADERTPLLPPLPERTEDDAPPLAHYAERLIVDLSSSGVTNAPIAIESPEPLAELTILLLAIEQLRQGHKDRTADASITNLLSEERRRSRLRQRIFAEVEKRLDHAECGDDTLTEILWTRWPIRDGLAFSALDLMVLDGASSTVLSHPLLHRFLLNLWKDGAACSASPGGHGLSRRLERCITPRRLHLVHLVSFLALWTMTISIALYPMGIIRPAATVSSSHIRPAVTEVLWAVIGVGTFYQVVAVGSPSQLRPLLRPLALLPLVLATCFAPFRRDLACNFLLLSIPLITLGLISPSCPSIAYLNPYLLPTSTRLFDLLRTGANGWQLTVPLIFVVFVTFSISMNGHIDRGGLLFTTTTITTTATITTEAETSPQEPGVAPFQARVVIFVTLILLVVMSLTVLFSNSTRWTDGTATPATARLTWEDTNGPRTARLARGHWIRSSGWLIGDTSHRSAYPLPLANDEERQRVSSDGVRAEHSHACPPALPPPLNLILLPLDLAISLSKPGKGPTWVVSITRIRYVSATILAGLVCCPFMLLTLPSTMRRTSG